MRIEDKRKARRIDCKHAKGDKVIVVAICDYEYIHEVTRYVPDIRKHQSWMIVVIDSMLPERHHK